MMVRNTMVAVVWPDSQRFGRKMGLKSQQLVVVYGAVFGGEDGRVLVGVAWGFVWWWCSTVKMADDGGSRGRSLRVLVVFAAVQAVERDGYSWVLVDGCWRVGWRQRLVVW